LATRGAQVAESRYAELDVLHPSFAHPNGVPTN